MRSPILADSSAVARETGASAHAAPDARRATATGAAIALRTTQPVLIVGGGIAGLALAIGLRRAGLDAEIWERVADYAPVGAGIALSVNAMAVLQHLGLGDVVERRGHVLQELFITDQRGRRLGGIDLTETARRYGNSVGIHRAELHHALVRAAAGTRIRAGVTVRSIETHDDGVRAESTGGHRGDYGLVVAADGIRSHVRDLVFGPRAPVYSGYTCWRFVVSNVERLTASTEMWGRGKRVGIVPIGQNNVYVFTTANAPAHTDDPVDGRVARFKARFSEFGGSVPRLLAQIQTPDQLLHNDIEEIWMERWHTGRVVLIGDAAHAMTPNTGQGAGMALEDAFTLSARLARGSSLEQALEGFETGRMRRVRAIHRASRSLGRVAQWSGPAACAVRNTLMRAVPDRVSLRGVRKIVAEGVAMIEEEAR